MRINEFVEIIRHKNGEFSLLSEGVKHEPSFFGLPDDVDLNPIYEQMVGRLISDKEAIFTAFCGSFSGEMGEVEVEEVHEETEEEKAARIRQQICEGLSGLMRFFSEFSFSPSFRFINSLGHALRQDTTTAKQYIVNYFKLIDSPYAGELERKMDSFEFNSILSNIAPAEMTHTVNNRFRIYYGSQGTGKTTMAMKETENLCMVCNSSMLPSDLMEDFTFDDGKAAFHPSALARCMEEGKPIVMDEINLLPFDSLRFLQGIFDGKTEFQYKGHTVHIKDGFKVIGTMNLTVNGVAFGLPEPLVDRCEMIKEFVLNPEMLMGAF